MIDDYFERPYWIVDILPFQVPADSPGQYFTVEEYYLRKPRWQALRRKYLEILLKLNCYYDMAVSFDSCMSWEINPDPEDFTERVTKLSGKDFFRAVFAQQNAMIDYDHNDTYLTVYDPNASLLNKLKALAAAEGLFVWAPPREKG